MFCFYHIYCWCCMYQTNLFVKVWFNVDILFLQRKNEWRLERHFRFLCPLNGVHHKVCWKKWPVIRSNECLHVSANHRPHSDKCFASGVPSTSVFGTQYFLVEKWVLVGTRHDFGPNWGVCFVASPLRDLWILSNKETTTMKMVTSSLVVGGDMSNIAMRCYWLWYSLCLMNKSTIQIDNGEE